MLTHETFDFCSPFRTYVGRVGGIRSNLPVDSNSLTPYYNSIMVCVNETLWNMPTTMSVESRMAAVRTMDFSIIRPDFRGFADALRVGRHAYLCPMNIAETTYSPYLIRISLGVYDIGTALDTANTTYGGIRSMVNTLNLSMVDTNLKGFSGLFTAGKYLFLVPYRNEYEPRNGQRGHGHAVRLDMNDFSMSGISHFDLTTTTRNQIPSFADTQLRGYSFGFACKCIVCCVFVFVVCSPLTVVVVGCMCVCSGVVCISGSVFQCRFPRENRTV